jgi:hypothetical protein
MMNDEWREALSRDVIYRLQKIIKISKHHMAFLAYQSWLSLLSCIHAKIVVMTVRHYAESYH